MKNEKEGMGEKSGKQNEKMKNAKDKNKEVWSNKNRKDVRVMEGQMEGK